MTIELSTITFTDQDDIVPSSGVERILNTGVANTLAGNDTITGSGGYDYYNPSTGSGYGIYNTGTLNTAEGNDIITGTGPQGGIYNTDTLNTAEGNDIITGTGSGTGYGIYNTGTFNTVEGNDIITATAGFGGEDGIYNTGTFNTAEGNDIITVWGRNAAFTILAISIPLMVTTKSLALPAAPRESRSLMVASSILETATTESVVRAARVPASTMAPSLSILVMVMTRSMPSEVITAFTTKDI